MPELVDLLSGAQNRILQTTEEASKHVPLLVNSLTRTTGSG